tara:strand:- start:192 stop:407 length:216 start_codon:yes stop_codon:yes gene_type:complete
VIPSKLTLLIFSELPLILKDPVGSIYAELTDESVAEITLACGFFYQAYRVFESNNPATFISQFKKDFNKER